MGSGKDKTYTKQIQVTKNEIYHAEILALNKRLYGDDYTERTTAFVERAQNADRSKGEELIVIEDVIQWLGSAHPFAVRLEYFIYSKGPRMVWPFNETNNAQYHH